MSSQQAYSSDKKKCFHVSFFGIYVKNLPSFIAFRQGRKKSWFLFKSWLDPTPSVNKGGGGGETESPEKWNHMPKATELAGEKTNQSQHPLEWMMDK